MEILVGLPTGMMIACPHCLRIGFFENILSVFYCCQIMNCPIDWGVWGINCIMKVLTCGCK